MKKIATIVVTYNRKDKLIKNLECLKTQTRKPDRIYVIDNGSTDETYKIFEGVNNESIKYIRVDKNLGGAGGFSLGLQMAYNDGYDYIWGMDDDAFPNQYALEKLENAINDFDEYTCFWSNCDDDTLFNNEYKIVDSWMFVGFFMPRNVITKVGFPRADFFIYHDDSEYAYRIIKNGYKIVKVQNSIIEHGNFNNRDKYYKKVFVKDISFPKMPDWKFYYYIRNYILKYDWNDLNKYKVIFYYLPKTYFKLLFLTVPQKNIFIKALLHGILNKSGKVMEP